MLIIAIILIGVVGYGIGYIKGVDEYHDILLQDGKIQEKETIN